MKNRHIILLLILNLIFELIFKSSNITNLVLLDFIVLAVTTMLPKNSSIFMFIIFIAFSIIVELFSFKLIGVNALAWFLGILAIKIIGNFIHIFNLNRKNFFSLLLLYLLFIVIRLIINSLLEEPTVIEFQTLVLNILILSLYNWVLNKFYNNKYVLER
jgi:hypothetical protein